MGTNIGRVVKHDVIKMFFREYNKAKKKVVKKPTNPTISFECFIKVFRCFFFEAHTVGRGGEESPPPPPPHLPIVLNGKKKWEKEICAE